MTFATYFEAAMLISFSLSWYWPITKMLLTKSACGRSLQFVPMVCAGYMFGITAKLLAWHQGDELSVLVGFYVWNLLVALIHAALMVRYAERGSASTPPPQPAGRASCPQLAGG